MQLWTFQATEAIQELEKTGVLRSAWKRYAREPKWEKAYRWMATQMQNRNIDCGTYAPIWAWHSCGAWKKAPSLGTATNLLSLQQLEAGIQTIAFDCPDHWACLSLYSAWGEVLDAFLDGADSYPETGKVYRDLFGFSPEKIEDYDAIQATIPFLKQEWVIDIRTLPLTASDLDVDLEAEV